MVFGKRMKDKNPMDPNYLSISHYLKNEKEIPKEKITPLQLADSLDLLCKQAIDQVQKIKTDNNVDLQYEVGDIKTWANLGLYFSNKLKAAVAYKQYIISNDSNDIRQAIAHLTVAVDYWHSVVEITTPLYKPVPLVHFSDNEDKDDYFHWSKIEIQVQQELAWLQALQTQ